MGVLGAVVPGIPIAVGTAVLGIDWFPHHLLISQFCFSLAAFIVVLKFIGHAYQFQGKKFPRIIFATVLSLITIGIDIWVVLKIEAHKEITLAVVESVPHLNAALWVDSKTVANASIRIVLENVGSVAISSLQTFMHSDIHSSMMLLPSSSTISSHQKTELESGFFIRGRPKEINLYLLYKTEPAGALHYSEFRFFIPVILAGAEPIAPIFIKEDVGDPLSAVNSINSEMVSAFLRSTGTIQFWFPEKKGDGSPNEVLLVGANRGLLVDSSNHKAYGWIGLRKIEKLAEVTLPPERQQFHGIAVVWNDTQGSLGIQVDQKPRISAITVIHSQRDILQVGKDKKGAGDVRGDDNTVFGSTPIASINGNGNTIVGATEVNGNTIIDKGGTAIGNGAVACPTCVSIGAHAGATTKSSDPEKTKPPQ